MTFDVTCTGKEAFGSPEVARRIADRMRKDGKPVRAYRCETCSKWHIGTPLRRPGCGPNGKRLKPSDPLRNKRP